MEVVFLLSSMHLVALTGLQDADNWYVAAQDSLRANFRNDHETHVARLASRSAGENVDHVEFESLLE